ncbi:DUF2240 family protein [Halobaculum gomorrense]|uniref:DUF2240 family protein n=1 Tax=Halobaculum gomorrense TaxID=43928 RepID=A0A1M5KRG1_9EURY|nr:DUF2240 family protein [Halobaculum gomorrense]SHG55325.1 hypothetical protein SAMN05443636_0614 [Halobaculum gomorrense]
MTLEAAVAAPFRGAGTDRMGEGEFVVALSLDRDWFSPDQAKRLVDIATGRGLLAEEDGDLVTQFDPAEVHVPADFVPDESILREQSTFEQAIDAIVADGMEKRDAVAAANRRQREAGVTLETAAVLVARERGVDVGTVAEAAREEVLAAADGANGGDERDPDAAGDDAATGGS